MHTESCSPHIFPKSRSEDLLDEVTYWIEQYWQYALFAAVAIVRACAERSDIPLETFVADLAARHGINID